MVKTWKEQGRDELKQVQIGVKAQEHPLHSQCEDEWSVHNEGWMSDHYNIIMYLCFHSYPYLVYLIPTLFLSTIPTLYFI